MTPSIPTSLKRRARVHSHRQRGNGGRSHYRSSRPPIHELLARHIAEAPSSFQAYHIPEPKLIFAGGHSWEDPKTGILQFGPASFDHGPRTTIRVGVIGTADTIQMLRAWIERARLPVQAGLNRKKKPYDPILFPAFPGFNDGPPYHCELDLSDRLRVTLTDREVAAKLDSDNFSLRVRDMVELIADRLCALAERHPPPDVVIIAMPKSVESRCGEGASDKPQSKKRSKAEIARQRDLERGQLSLFDLLDGDGPPLDSNHFRGFRNALKRTPCAQSSQHSSFGRAHSTGLELLKTQPPPPGISLRPFITRRVTCRGSFAFPRPGRATLELHFTEKGTIPTHRPALA